MGFFLFPGAVSAKQGGESRGRFAEGPGRFFARSLFFACFPVFIYGNKEAGPGILPGH
jgi:hypothetical protein